MTWFLLVFVFGVGPAVRGLLRATAGRRPDVRQPADVVCQACQLDHPPFANYCRNCGRRL